MVNYILLKYVAINHNPISSIVLLEREIYFFHSTISEISAPIFLKVMPIMISLHSPYRDVL